MNIILTMITDNKKEEHRLDKAIDAKEMALEKMADANLYGSYFKAQIYREGPPRELLTVVTNTPS
jgi:hypothetical protein